MMSKIGTKIGKNVYIAENCSIGLCDIANEVTIHRGALIEHGVRIASGAKIGAGSIIGSKAKIGKNARLGEGVIVETEVSVKPNTYFPAGSIIKTKKK